jgi:hypothetical protein
MPGFFHHPCVCQQDLELLDATFNESLLVLGAAYSASSISSPPSMASCRRLATSGVLPEIVQLSLEFLVTLAC